MVSAHESKPGPGDWREANQAMWDERVPHHVASDFYDLRRFRERRDALRAFETEELGDVAGKRLLHLQCHLGTDTLSWALRGAEVTGLDFSGAAVEAARKLAAELELSEERARFVAADVYDAPVAVGGARFDVVYTGLGALCWLPDLPRWAQTVASLLEPGGVLYLAEFHPVANCLGEGGTAIAEDYFARDALVFDEPGSYAARDADTRHNRSVEWQHTLGDVVSAVAGAGLRVEFLHEFDFTLFEHAEGMVQSTDATGTTVFRLPPGSPRAPLLYSLRASRG